MPELMVNSTPYHLFIDISFLIRKDAFCLTHCISLLSDNPETRVSQEDQPYLQKTPTSLTLSSFLFQYKLINLILFISISKI